MAGHAALRVNKMLPLIPVLACTGIASSLPGLGPLLTGLWERDYDGDDITLDKHMYYENNVLLIHLPTEPGGISGPVLVLVYSRSDSEDWWISVGHGYVGPLEGPHSTGSEASGLKTYGVSVRLLPSKRKAAGDSELVYAPAQEKIMFSFSAPSPTVSTAAEINTLERYPHHRTFYRRRVPNSSIGVADTWLHKPTVQVAPAATNAMAYDLWFAASLGDADSFRNMTQGDTVDPAWVSKCLRRPSPLGDMPPLLLACRHGNLRIVEITHQLSQDPRYAVLMSEKRMGLDSTPLAWAAVHEQWEVVRFLLGTGNVEIDDSTRSKLERPTRVYKGPGERREGPEERRQREEKWSMHGEGDLQRLASGTIALVMVRAVHKRTAIRLYLYLCHQMMPRV